MLSYREVAPRPPLDRFVHCFWTLEHTPGPTPEAEKIVPDGHPELIFQLGAPYRRPNSQAAQPTSFAVGQIRRWLEVLPTGTVNTLGVRFRPAGLRALFGDSLHVLTDDELALADWAPPALVEAEEGLHGAATWNERCALLEDVLTKLLCNKPAGDPRIEGAVAMGLASRGRSSLDTIAGAAGVSARTLDRLFQREVGLTPKLFLRQIRFQHVFELLGKNPQLPWSELAIASGCYDQAHLNREFRAFAGEPPQAFMRAEHELSNHLTGLAAQADE